GPAAIAADLSAVFDGADTRLLLATACVVALLLLLTYRSPVLWLIPLSVVAVADRLATVFATQVMAALGVAWDGSTTGILSVLVFGAGTDYALLLISRYRDELKATPSRNLAMARALRRTAEAVLASATTVFLGLLTLLLSLIPTTRGLGLACAIGIVVAAGFVMLVLPAFLVLFGRWVFWPRVPHVGDTALVDGRGPWRRIGD
ncbi:MMPL family transporter, partial [Nocardioides hankookensis]